LAEETSQWNILSGRIDGCDWLSSGQKYFRANTQFRIYFKTYRLRKSHNTHFKNGGLQFRDTDN
jgi:hypothetical protein